MRTRPLEQWRVERALRARIKAALDDAGIAVAVGVGRSRTASTAAPPRSPAVSIAARCHALLVVILIFVLAVALVARRARPVAAGRSAEARRTPAAAAPARGRRRPDATAPSRAATRRARGRSSRGAGGRAPSAEVAESEAPRLRDRLGKTRAAFARSLARAAAGARSTTRRGTSSRRRCCSPTSGMPTTQRILDGVRERGRGRADRRRRRASLGAAARASWSRCSTTAATATLVTRTPGEPNVWMFVGVNGVGKTTTIAKVAQREADDGHTRRARRRRHVPRRRRRAARATGPSGVGAELVRGQEGADPGSVVFDAMSAAASRGADLVLVDTAGRLHTKVNLMEELKKLRRIVDRTPGRAQGGAARRSTRPPARTGSPRRAQFAEAVDVTGVVLTKLDGTAKGGIVLAIEAELGIPVKLIGVGESAADLIAFEPESFVAALLELSLRLLDVRRALRPLRRHLHEAAQPRASSPTRTSTRSRARSGSRCSRPTSTSSSSSDFIARVKERARTAPRSRRA